MAQWPSQDWPIPGLAGQQLSIVAAASSRSLSAGQNDPGPVLERKSWLFCLDPLQIPTAIASPADALCLLGLAHGGLAHAERTGERAITADHELVRLMLATLAAWQPPLLSGPSRHLVTTPKGASSMGSRVESVFATQAATIPMAVATTIDVRAGSSAASAKPRMQVSTSPTELTTLSPR